MFEVKKMAESHIDDEEAEEAKITIRLSKKALTTLDVLKEESGFGSRGRTIEESILAVNDIREWLKLYLQVVAQSVKEGKTLGSDVMGSIWLQIIQIISRFGRVAT